MSSSTSSSERLRFLVLLALLVAPSRQQTPISPCPDVFSYEQPGSEPGRWYGVVNLSTDTTLHSVWVIIVLDSKADILGNWVGDVTTSDNIEFKIENTKMKIQPGPAMVVRFFVQYNPLNKAPKLQAISLNGREICNLNTPIPIVDKHDYRRKTKPDIKPEDTPQSKPLHGQPSGTGPGYSSTQNALILNIGGGPIPAQSVDSQTGTRTGSGYGSGTQSGSSFGTGTQTGSDYSSGTQSGNGFGSGTQTGSNLGSGTQSGNGFSSGTQTGSNFGIGTQSGSSFSIGTSQSGRPDHGYRLTTAAPMRTTTKYDGDFHDNGGGPIPAQSVDSQTGTRTGSGYGSGTQSGSSFGTGTQIGSDYYSGTQSGNGFGSGTQTGSNLGSGTHSGNGFGSGTQTSSNLGSGTQSGFSSGTQTGSNFGTGTHSGSSFSTGTSQSGRPENGYRLTTAAPMRTTTKYDDEGDYDDKNQYFEGPQPTLIVASRPDNNNNAFVNNEEQAQCGKVVWNNPNPHSGQSTLEGQWPWQIALYQTRTVDNKYICGGTLVSRSHVITAAHCVTRKDTNRVVNRNTLTVYLGKHNLRTSVEGVQIKLVGDIRVPPSYHAKPYSRDVSVLKLREQVRYSDWVRPVCLWPDNEIDLSIIIGKKGSVVGWGFDDKGVATEELTLVEMPVVDQETCIRSYSEFYPRFTSDYAFCAGYNGGSPVCKGDSGGGMVFYTRGAWFLRGLVSFSVARHNEYRCDPSHHVVVFTDLAKFLPWIRQNISDE